MDATATVLLLGRLIFGGYFVMSGIAHFRNHKAMAQYAAAKGTPAPTLAVLATGALMTAGGLSVITGILPILGLAALAVFLVGVTPVMHAFWTIQDPMTRMAETVNFTKNVALLGAVFALMALPRPWQWSLPLGA